MNDTTYVEIILAVETAAETAEAGGPALVFTFCRIVKGWRFTANGVRMVPSGEEMANHLERVCRQNRPGEDFWESQLACTRDEFIVTFESVRVPNGKTILGWALELVEAAKRQLQPAEHGSLQTYVKFINLAARLQQIRGDQPIALPTVAIGRVLGIGPWMISEYRRWAQGSRILRKVGQHSITGKRATTFIFDLDKFNRNGKEIAD